jgi:hypothetical protein
MMYLFTNRHADFFVGSSTEIVHSFQVTEDSLPAVFMLPSEGDGFIKYTGALLEQRVVDWVLRQSEPAMSELSVSTKQGEACVVLLLLINILYVLIYIS